VPAFIFFYISINYLAVLSSFAIVGGLYFFFLGFQLLARKRLLASTPNSRIRSAALGLVEINGRATGPNTMPAPATGRPCFLYHTIAWQKPEGKSDWKKVADETLHLPFFVDDTTGKMLIEPLGAELDLERDFQEEYATSLFFSSDDIPLRVRSFLARHTVSYDRSLRVAEYVIKPDDALFVAGTVTENPGVELRPRHSETLHQNSASIPGADATAPQVISLYGGPAAANASEMTQQGKIAAALNRAGITKPEAWSAAGVPYQAMAIEPASPLAVVDPGNPLALSTMTSDSQNSQNGFIDSSTFDLSPPVVLMKGENDTTFVISFRSQKELVSSLAWKSAGMVWGGAVITLLGFYMLLLQFGLFN
jgi:hypothetical protein